MEKEEMPDSNVVEENPDSLYKWCWGAFIFSPAWYFFNGTKLLGLCFLLLSGAIVGVVADPLASFGLTLILAYVNGKFAYQIQDWYLGLFESHNNKKNKNA